MVALPKAVSCGADCPNRRVGCHNDTCPTHVMQQAYLAQHRAAGRETAMLREDMITSANRHRSFSGWIEKPQTLRKKANKQAW